VVGQRGAGEERAAQAGREGPLPFLLPQLQKAGLRLRLRLLLVATLCTGRRGAENWSG
jgi:hypothetical protein